ncbi:MAG: hypothetical protein M0011_12660 [Elusimicrobia bacterium]|nr:hypothetical protein [Elusimicrobiota bacterium]
MGHLLLLLYSLLAPAIAALYAVFFLFSPRRTLMKALSGELDERLALTLPAFDTPPVWLHAASMGEVKALSQLAPTLAGEFKAPLLVTSSTAAGRAEAARLIGFKARTATALLAPLDFYPLAARLIAAARPRLLVVVETEIWPATLYAAANAGVPVYMVNARLSPSTAALYRALGPFTRLAFTGVRKVLAQSEEDAARFETLPGLAGKVSVTGNLKHDLLPAGSTVSEEEIRKRFLPAAWGADPVFTAGSTHPPEEPAIIDAWLEARKKTPALRLVLVPRHPERIAETEAVLASRGITHVRWTQGAADSSEPCLLVDKMGILSFFYAVSDVCFVGGTLDDTGGHNLLEPAIFGKPVLFGPNYRNARAAGLALIKEKGGFLTGTAPEMAEILSALLSDPAAMKTAADNAARTLTSLKGATSKTVGAITGPR